MKSQEILPKDQRLSILELEKDDLQLYAEKLEKALEAAELEIMLNESLTKNFFKEETIKLSKKLEESRLEINMLKQEATDRYTESLEYLARMWQYDIEDVKSTMSKNYMLDALKIASYGNKY